MNTIVICASDVWVSGLWLAAGVTLTSPMTWRVVAWLIQMKTLLMVMLGQATRAQLSDAYSRAQALVQSARRALAQGDLDAALSLAQMAHERFDLANDTAGASQAQVVFGQVLSQLGQLTEARNAFDRSLVGLGPGKDRAQALTLLAEVYAMQNNHSQAGDLYQQALNLYRHLGIRSREAHITHRLAYALYEQARWAEAETLYRQALTLADELNLRAIKASLLLEIGNSVAQQGQTPEARRWFERSITQAQANRDQTTLADALHSLATVCALDGETERATTLFATVLNLRTATGDTVAASHVRSDLAMLSGLTQPDAGQKRATRNWQLAV